MLMVDDTHQSPQSQLKLSSHLILCHLLNDNPISIRYTTANSPLCCPQFYRLLHVQAKEYLFSLLVWHERLLYGSSADSRDAAAAAASAAAAALSQQLGRLGSGLRGLLGRSAAVEP